MSKLTTDNIKLLDKVYNLRGSDSTILVKMEQEMETNANVYDETSTIRQELEDKIQELNNDVEVLSDEGEKLKNILNDINESDYEKLLDTLKIDFHPSEIKEKLESLLPVTVNGLVSDIKMSSNELSRVEDKLQETKTKMEELNLQKEEALVNQDRLNRYLELALNSNINVTREELTSLFTRLEFDEEEARECAKLFMFPEDGLFEYESEYKDAPRIEEEKKVQDEINVVEEPVIEDSTAAEPVLEEESPITFISADEVDKEDNLTVIEDNSPEEAINDFITEKDELAVDEIKEVEPTDLIVDRLQEVIPSKEEVISYLTDLGFDSLDFTTNDIDKIVNNYNQDIINENVNTIKEMGINLDVFADNIELLYDKEMKMKIDKLTSIGKLPQDIYLYPSVLTKYNLNELDSAIKVLQDSGLEPKNVPLMAY